MSQDANITLRADAIGKSYPTVSGELVVLENLSLAVKAGEMIAIVGESGVGKSTLLHILGGLDQPTSGSVFCDGQKLSDWNEDERSRFRNRNIGFVFQFHHLLEDFSALENVALPALAAGLDWNTARSRAEELLEKLGVLPRQSHAPAELSGGEQQRVAVARALINRPRLLLADEPTGNLDTKTGERLHQTLVDINRESGAGFIIATHNLELAHRCSLVYKLEGGQLHLSN